MKKCRRCQIEKPESDFYANNHNPDKLHSYCKPCLIEVDRDNRWKRSGQRGYVRTRVVQPVNGCARICTKCREEKPVSEFSTNGLDPKGGQKYRSLCKPCSNNSLRAFHKNNPEKRRKYVLSKNFKMSPDTFEAIFNMQGRRCVICRTDTPTGHGWTVDHDHACCSGEKSCGKCVRGILCMHCNNMLGCARDRVEVLQAGIDYLKKFVKTSTETVQPRVPGFGKDQIISIADDFNAPMELVDA